MSEDIITVTEAAVTHIKSMMRNRPEAEGFRLSVKRTGCSGYQYVTEVMTEVNQQDVAVPVRHDLTVYVDRACVDKIKGTRVDFVKKNLGETRWVFDNPNAESECGCGESFNLKED